MKFDNEKELENILVDVHKKTGLCHVLDESVGRLYQQFNLPGYGVIDLLGVDVCPYSPTEAYVGVTIYELKNTPITAGDAAQIARYFQGMRRYFDVVHGVNISPSGNCNTERVIFHLKGVLVGPGYSNSDVCWIVDASPWLSCYHFSLGPSGIKYEDSSGWYNENETEGEIDGLDLKADIEGVLQGCDSYIKKNSKAKECK